MKKPSNKRVVRQHDETQVPEVCGIPCSTFHVVYSKDSVIEVLYLKLDDTWHRFFLDAGCLFWREGEQPDEDNDLLDGDEYLDWGQQLGVVGVALSEVSMMKNSTLTLRFDNGAEVVLKHLPFDENTSLLRFTPAAE